MKNLWHCQADTNHTRKSNKQFGNSQKSRIEPHKDVQRLDEEEIKSNSA